MMAQKLSNHRKHQLQALITGQVHGVFYRANTKEKADELGLVGYVRNTSDGVEVVAEGQVELIEQFEKFLWHASPYAQVKNVESIRSEVTGEFNEFEIR